MGTKLSSILTTKEISTKDLSGKKLAVDSFNLLYQFLTTIRQQDGSPLTNSQGKITSHVSGLFFRTTKLMKENIDVSFNLTKIKDDNAVNKMIEKIVSVANGEPTKGEILKHHEMLFYLDTVMY